MSKTATSRKETDGPVCIPIGARKITLTPADQQKVESVHDYLGEHACMAPTIRELAHMAGISEQKLKAGFVHRYATTPWRYANDVRMDTAARLLASTQATVKQVCLACGYRSEAAFSTMFKRWSGLSPQRYRTDLLFSGRQ